MIFAAVRKTTISSQFKFFVLSSNETFHIYSTRIDCEFEFGSVREKVDARTVFNVYPMVKFLFL
jgi:hypothetical protein